MRFRRRGTNGWTVWRPGRWRILPGDFHPLLGRKFHKELGLKHETGPAGDSLCLAGEELEVDGEDILLVEAEFRPAYDFEQKFCIYMAGALSGPRPKTLAELGALYPGISQERQQWLVKLHHNGGHFATLGDRIADKQERRFFEDITNYDLCSECASFNRCREILWPVGWSQFGAKPRVLWGGDSVNTAMGIVYHLYDFGSQKRSLALIDHHLPDKVGKESEPPPPQVPAALLAFKTKAGGLPRFFMFDPKSDNLNQNVENFCANNDVQGVPVPYASPWCLGKEERAHPKFNKTLNKVLLITGGTKLALLEEIVGMRNISGAVRDLVDVIYNCRKLDADQFELKDKILQYTEGLLNTCPGVRGTVYAADNCHYGHCENDDGKATKQVMRQMEKLLQEQKRLALEVQRREILDKIRRFNKGYKLSRSLTSLEDIKRGEMVRILRTHDKNSDHWHAGTANWRQVGTCVGVDTHRQEAMVRPSGSNRIVVLRAPQVKKFVFAAADIKPGVQLSEYMTAPLEFRTLPGILVPTPKNPKPALRNRADAAADLPDDKNPPSRPKKIVRGEENKKKQRKTKPAATVLPPLPLPAAPSTKPHGAKNQQGPPVLPPAVSSSNQKETLLPPLPQPEAAASPLRREQLDTQARREEDEIFGSPIPMEPPTEPPTKARRLYLTSSADLFAKGAASDSFATIDDRGAAYSTFDIAGSTGNTVATLATSVQDFVAGTTARRAQLVEDGPHLYLAEAEKDGQERVLETLEDWRTQLRSIDTNSKFLMELIAQRGRQTVFRSSFCDPIVTELNTLINGKPVSGTASGFDGSAYVVEAKVFRRGCRVPGQLGKHTIAFRVGPKTAFQVFDPSTEIPSPDDHHLFLQVEQPAAVNWEAVTPNGCSVELTLQQIAKYGLWHLVDEARAAEVKGIQALDVFDLSSQRDERPEGEDVSVVSSRIVFTLKFSAGQFTKAKMRWCAKGYMDRRLEEGLEKRCHTVADSSILVVLHWLAKNKHYAHLADIAQAFLRGKELQDAVWLEVPEGIRGNNAFGLGHRFVRLKRCLYGLADAPLSWQKVLFQALRDAGWKQDINDPCLWYFPKAKPEQQQQEESNSTSEKETAANGDEERREQSPLLRTSIEDPLLQSNEIEGILGVHVDDMLYGGSAAAHRSLEKVFLQFPPGSRTCLLPGTEDTFCGRTIHCEQHDAAVEADQREQFEFYQDGKLVARATAAGGVGFKVGQQSFIRNMKPISEHELQHFLQNRRRKSPLRRALGELLWVTKVQIAFVANICILAGQIDDEASDDDYGLMVSEVNELIDQVKQHGEDVIHIQPTAQTEDILLGLVDASLVPRLGAMVCLVNKKQAASGGTPCGDEKGEKLVYNIITHYSAKPSRVFSSSTSAELLALRLVVSELLYFRGVCVASGLTSPAQPLIVCSDSNNVVRSSTNSLTRSPSERNLRADYFYLSRLVEDGDLCLCHIKGKHNPSDILTKEVAKCDLDMVRGFLQFQDAKFVLPPEALTLLEP
ncbi:unnamed protein product [Amoebophrya sp. A120]|nr:unnamed protein product [Amoebophrya sp. A120]|eukprot:GSA120T00013026001.1